METANEDTEAMMTAMGMAAFASTKVSLSTISLSFISNLFKGKTCHWQSRGRRQRQKVSHLATIHEQVRLFSFLLQSLICFQTWRL